MKRITRTSIISLFTLLALSCPLSGAGADWPQFRGPTGQGVSEATGLPSEWSPEKNVAWKVELPGRGWSSPSIAGGKIYLTSAVGQGEGSLTLRALCMDASSGKQIWDTEVFKPGADAPQAMHKKNSPASPTPIVTSDRVYVHFGPLGTAALDLEGKIIWKQEALKFPPVHGNGGSPALVDGLLIFSCDGASNPSLAALDAKDGKVKWRTPRQTPAKRTFSFSTPLAIEVGGKTQVISPTSGFVGGYDPTTGKELWRVRYGEGYSVVPRPVFAHGLLFVSSGFDAPIAMAVRPDGAKGDASSTAVAWSNRKGAPCTPSMVVVGDEVYYVSDGGVMTCADAKTGKVNYTQRLGGGFSASPVAADGKIYFQNEEGVGYVVKAGTKFESLGENDLGERSLASYGIADNALFIRTEKHLWKIAQGK